MDLHQEALGQGWRARAREQRDCALAHGHVRAHAAQSRVLLIVDRCEISHGEMVDVLHRPVSHA
ncbi:MAG TPA: hypothetical protein VGF67_07135 [Ktedonobacteraceae bacterium]